MNRFAIGFTYSVHWEHLISKSHKCFRKRSFFCKNIRIFILTLEGLFIPLFSARGDIFDHSNPILREKNPGHACLDSPRSSGYENMKIHSK